MTLILTDADLVRVDIMPVAIEAVEAALLARRGGRLIAPPRHKVAFGEFGSLVFTVGGTLDGAPVAGFRVYDTFAGSQQDQIVAVWSADSGRLLGIIVGEQLGAIRTGAIGAVAIRRMSSPVATTLGIVGTGLQARTQLRAAAQVRKLTRIRVHSRNVSRREAFASTMSALVGIEVEPVATAEAAVSGADIVVCATSSATPVIEASWLKPGAHVNTVGPKLAIAHELGVDIARRAQWLVTDSLEQVRAYQPAFFLEGTPEMDRMIELANVAEAKGTRDENMISLFCSTGLAGTETMVAAAAIHLLGGQT
jgi:ornithine cyclodeaminase/alanine dehydrogenase-like protein (mu-crystallin family)